MNFILMAHHYIAFVLIFLMAFTVSYVFYVALKKHQKTGKMRKLTIITISLLHLQLIFGLLLTLRYFFSLSDAGFSFKEVMGNAAVRYQALEHPLMMLIAIALATIAHVHLKKSAHNKKAAFLLLIAFVCMLGRVPFDKLFA